MARQQRARKASGGRRTPASSPSEADLARLGDAELVRGAQAGSNACFAQLVCRYEARLLRFLLQRTRRLHDAEDLLQDTFVRAYERIASYDPRWRLTTWLYTIAARLACSHHRKRRAALLPEPARTEDDAPDPADIAADNEQRDNLWSLAAQTLSDNQYRALWLRYAEGMSVKEISRVMKKTQTHVKVLLFRGRSGLGRRLTAAAAAAGRANVPAEVPAPCTTGAKGGG